MNAYLQQKLAQDDETLFLQGACHLFADELLPRLLSQGFSLRRLADMNSTTVQMQARHVYLLRDDVMVDVLGKQSERSYIQEMREERLQNGGPLPDFRSLECSRDELFLPVPRDNDFERGLRNRWYHLLDAEFVTECRMRAQRLILQSPEKYDS